MEVACVTAPNTLWVFYAKVVSQLWFGCHLVCIAYCFNRMMRTLRSNTRREKLQVQHIKQEHIKQVDRALRSHNITISDYEPKIHRLDQKEFLSLFDLIPLKHRNGLKGRTEKSTSKSIKKVRHTKTIINNLSKPKNIRGKRILKKSLNKSEHLKNPSDSRQDTSKNTFEIQSEQQYQINTTELGKTVENIIQLSMQGHIDSTIVCIQNKFGKFLALIDVFRYSCCKT